MSTPRLILLLLVLCACVAVSIRGQSDPTFQCYSPQPTADGGWVTDFGYWDLTGLQSTYSSSYSVMCAFRGLYQQGPAGANTSQYGPWHGNPNDTNCEGPNLSQFANSLERGNPSSGNLASRKNAATGGSILTSFRITGFCDGQPDNSICAGHCFGFPGYDDDEAVLQQDPTYQVSSFLAPAAAPSATQATAPSAPQPKPYTIVTTLNSTQIVMGNVTQSRSPYSTTKMSAITSLQKCTGTVNINCPSQGPVPVGGGQ